MANANANANVNGNANANAKYPRFYRNSTNVVVIVSQRRAASTDMAEAFGLHPCAVSFNELFMHTHVPVGNPKYDPQRHIIAHSRYTANTSIIDFIKIARNRYCENRPAVVRDVCGDTCVVSWKMHDNYVRHNPNPNKFDNPFTELLRSNDVSIVVTKRDAAERECSLKHARSTNDWGHNPDEHQEYIKNNPTSSKIVNIDESNHPCPINASGWFLQQQEAYYQHINEQIHHRESGPTGDPINVLILPFEEYTSDTEASKLKLLEFAGLTLANVPLEYQNTCTVSWCKTFIWPTLTTIMGENELNMMRSNEDKLEKEEIKGRKNNSTNT